MINKLKRGVMVINLVFMFMIITLFFAIIYKIQKNCDTTIKRLQAQYEEVVSNTHNDTTKQQTSDYEPKNEVIEQDMFKVASDMYNIDYFLLKAISIHETGHFKSKAWLEYNNAGGIMGKNGLVRYESKEAGIMAMARLLKTQYIDKGYDTIEKIQKKYAPLNVKNDPNNLNRHWISGVTNIYNELKSYWQNNKIGIILIYTK